MERLLCKRMPLARLLSHESTHPAACSVLDQDQHAKHPSLRCCILLLIVSSHLSTTSCEGWDLASVCLLLGDAKPHPEQVRTSVATTSTTGLRRGRRLRPSMAPRAQEGAHRLHPRALDHAAGSAAGGRLHHRHRLPQARSQRKATVRIPAERGRRRILWYDYLTSNSGLTLSPGRSPQGVHVHVSLSVVCVFLSTSACHSLAVADG